MVTCSLNWLRRWQKNQNVVFILGALALALTFGALLRPVKANNGPLPLNGFARPWRGGAAVLSSVKERFDWRQPSAHTRVVAAAFAPFSAVSLTALGVPYTQNFDTLPASGSATWTNDSTIPGWFHARSGTGTTVVANDGSSNAGNLYSYGTGTNTDRALGSLGSGNAAIGNLFWGVQLQNNTGSTITSLTVSYTGEQWRNSAAAAQAVAFSYLVGSPNVTGSLAEFQSAGVDVSALNFTSPITGGAAGALNGNSAANRVALSFTITGLSIPDGTQIMLRWSDPDHTGADHGLAIDDFSVTPNGGAVTPTLNISDVTMAEGDPPGSTTFTFAVTLTAQAGAGGVTFDIVTADGTATTANNDYVAQSLTGQTIPAGSTGPYNFNVTVNRDTTAEANETFFVNVTNITGANAGDAQGQGTISNDDVTLTPIHDIQGPGSSSPIVGATVTTRGIVTGVKSNGFYLQEPDATVDADPATSEGVFVFTNSAPPAAVAVGNQVQVAGTVAEFVPSADPLQPPLTELTSPTVLQLSSGNPLPAPVSLTNSFPAANGPFDQLERVEGMRVSVTSLTVVAPTEGTVSEANATSTSNGVFYGVVTGVARPFREPGIRQPDPAPSGTIPPIPRWDSNPELIRVDSDALTGAAALNVATDAVVTGLVGPLDYTFRAYTILPDPGSSLGVSGGKTATVVSTPANDEFTIASFNLERFFDDVNDPGIGEPVLTSTAFNTRLAKASLAIRNHLKTPDIVGVIELENLSTLQALAARISADALAASQPDPQYVAYLKEGNDVGGIDVGFLVKTAPVAGATPRVSVTEDAVQELKNTLFVNPDSSTELLNDRPPLRLMAVVNHANGASFPVTVIVNHLRSLNDVDNPAAGSNGWPTSGARVRAKRLAQAVDLANLVQARQVADPNERIVLIGDFNAFQFNDGFVDSMNLIGGTPTPDNETAVPGDGVDLVNPNFTNLVTTLASSAAYSFVFDGSAQFLDHVLVNAPLLTGTLAQRIEHPLFDADFPETERGNATVANRVSDHDPLLAVFKVAAFQTADLAITKTDSPDPVTAGTNLTYTISVTNNGPDAAANASWSDTLPAGTTFVSLPNVANWSCTTPAVGAGGTVSCSNASVAVGSAMFTLTVAVASNVTPGTVLSNTASVTSATADSDSMNNSVTATTTVAAVADLSVTKVDTPDPVTAGNNLTYTITVNNAGPSNAASVSLSDTLPTGTTFVSLSAPGGWSCTTPPVGSAGTVSCSIATLAAGSASFTLVVKVGSEVPGGTILSNTATITSSTADPASGNESATATTTVSSAATMTQLSSSLNPSLTGQSVTFTATVTASGNPVTSGSVTFSVDGIPQAANVSLDGAGQATFTTSALTEGEHVIQASYSGFGGFSASAGSINQRVDTPTVVNGNTYCNPGGITIQAGTAGVVRAAPYPSRIFVTGFSGTLAKVTLTLNNFTHEAPNDLSFLLVGPNGNKFVFMSGVGGTNPVTGANVTFDDAAASALSTLATGTFKPTAASTSVTFPAPAPALPTFAAPAEAATFASNFNGINPNGTWALFVVDQTSGATVGSIGEWCLTFTAPCPTITVGPAANLNATVGLPFSQVFTQTGGATPVSFALNGTLPNGLQFNGNTLSGTPGETGMFSFTVTAQDANGCLGSQAYTLVVGCPPITLSPATLPNGGLGAAYQQQLTAGPVAASYSFAVTGGALPPGLNLTSNGLLSGLPTAAGPFTFTVTASGLSSCAGAQTYTVSISSICQTVTVEPPTLPSGAVGTPYNQTLTASGSAGPFSFAVTGGALPSGLNLSSSGALTGTPLASGFYSFTITATGVGDCTGSRLYTLNINCAGLTWNPASLPNAEAGVAYNQSVSATGATSYSVLTGNLPPGLNLNAASGAINGTATATGLYNFTILATAAGGCSGSQTYSIAVVCPGITLNPTNTTLPSGSVGTAYSQTFSATPSGNYSFAVSGTLPPGLTFNSATGGLSGTPTTLGTYNFTVKATGFGACMGSQSYTLAVTAACATITLPALPATGKVGVNYFGSLAGTTPSASYTFTVVNGALPPGVSINNLFAALMGKPTAAGSYTFTLKATRSNGCTGTQEYTIVISNLANAVARLSDFDGDGKSDLGVWRGTKGEWLVIRSADGQTSSAIWGTELEPYRDVIASGDYDGDGLTDLAVYRRSDGNFYVQGSRDGIVQVQELVAGDNLPVAGDYDGDGQTDFAIWQPATGNWLIKRSSDGELKTVVWGAGFAPYNDVPVPGDYDGDGKTDCAIFRPATGTWYVLRSKDGSTTVQAWGAATDVPVAGDYDGDGKADMAVWRGSTGEWFVLRSMDNSYIMTRWGALAAGDTPVPGDYDGDGKLDFAVWRVPEGRWYVLQSRDNTVRVQQHGQVGDQPLTVRRHP